MHYFHGDEKSSLMAKRSLFCLCTLAAALCFGCSNDSSDDPTVTPGDTPGDKPGVTPGETPGVTPGEKPTEGADMVFSMYQDHDPVERTFEMNARLGCALDGDCKEGMFCFHGTCTSECSDTNPCAKGTCSKNGRCVVKSTKSLRSLDEDLNEAKNSDVVEKIPGAEILFLPADKVYVEAGADFAFVTIVAMKDYGPISYTVANAKEDTVSGLKHTTATVDSKTGQATYTFTIPAKESSLGDKGESEHITIDTSVGNYEVVLMPRKPATGLYEGAVSADQFSGVSLPIRMIIETKPAQISSFKDITGMTIYLPVSGNDIFSPESVGEDGNTKWSKVVMKKETTNCMDSDLCWSANYATNDYTFPKSELLDASQKVNRAIRVEINGYDENAMMFDGSIRDILAGVYRKVDDKGKTEWAKATMDGKVVVTRKASFDANADEYKNAIVTHTLKPEELRNLNDSAANVCTNDDIKELMKNAGSSCSGITSLTAYDSAQNKTACLLAATSKILESTNLVSKIIEELMTKEANNQNPVSGGFKNLNDFLDDCALDNGICREHHEYLCGVDLLGRAYLTSNESNKQEMLDNWHQLLRESYLGRQFSAWQNDVKVRRKWLENTETPSFLVNVLEKINTEMLEEWENKVFASHLYVLKQQFNQTSLEVLTRIDNSNEIKSSRDLILAEFTDGWTGVSDSMALGLRRYDALYQDTKKRTNKAAAMRPHLFDLYYSGLVETAINRDTGNNSLNGSYGKNFYENVARLKSLDQSFDDLVFMRDAEVVTSTSLDPQSGNLQVLADRKALAKQAVAAAAEKRKTVFQTYDDKLISQASINATLTNAIESLRTEITNICGLPNGCTSPKEANCMPRVAVGFCGFDLPANTNVPGDLSKTFDTPISKTEINNYYSAQNFEISEEDLDNLMLTASDIKAMTKAERDELLGLTDADYKNKDGQDLSEEDVDALIDESISKYLANLSSLRQINLTDYYSMTNNGEAAEAILAYRAAMKNVDIAKADFTALSNKVGIARSVCESYAANIEKWNSDREELLEQVRNNINKINEHYDNITSAERQKIDAELDTLKTQYLAETIGYLGWNILSTNYVSEQTDYIKTIQHLTNASLSLDFAAAVTERGIEALTAYAEDPCEKDQLLGVMSVNGLYKGIVTSAGNIILDALDAANLGLNIAINNNQAYMDINALNYEFDVADLEKKVGLASQEAELELAKSLAKWTEYADEASCKAASASECHSIVSCECPDDVGDIYSEVSCPESKGCHIETQWVVQGLDQWILSEQNAIDTLDEVNDTLRELFEIRNAYERDIQDLEFKRSEYLKLAQDLLVKRENILQAQIQEYAARKHYFTVVQRAMMLESQYNAASDRLQIINNLYTTPSAVFSFASDIDAVESKIELAKERIYDYLAAVEYLAVRPFVDLRRATYLARSTNDLEKIVDQIDNIVSVCGGGKPNDATVEISAREMMGITKDFATMTMAERFQSVIAKGNIPVNSLTRYTVEDSVRDLVNKGLDLRSGTFAVTVDKSMNLATTCNAKIDSIAVQIVGEDIIKDGAGSIVIPTITIFYDGQSKLVSCQPNIESLVKTIGDKTSYGKYSTFVTEPIKMSPPAKINEYGDPNYTFAGKPFATSYTVLIDTQVSENSKIDWNKVEDIKLLVKYTYQDLFPYSSACVNL